MNSKTNKQPERVPGFNCPKCNFFIEVSLQSLLYDHSHKCPSCLTEFSMDRQESKQALELIQKVYTAMQNLETAKNFKK